jgi:hypothetical protein
MLVRGGPGSREQRVATAFLGRLLDARTGAPLPPPIPSSSPQGILLLQWIYHDYVGVTMTDVYGEKRRTILV